MAVDRTMIMAPCPCGLSNLLRETDHKQVLTKTTYFQLVQCLAEDMKGVMAYIRGEVNPVGEPKLSLHYLH